MTAEDFIRLMFDDPNYISWSQHVVDGKWVRRQPPSLIIDTRVRFETGQDAEVDALLDSLDSRPRH